MKFKIGNKVKIKTKQKNLEKWSEDAIKFIGKIATVIKMRRDCYVLDVDNGVWDWYEKELEHYKITNWKEEMENEI